MDGWSVSSRHGPATRTAAGKLPERTLSWRLTAGQTRSCPRSPDRHQYLRGRPHRNDGNGRTYFPRPGQPRRANGPGAVQFGDLPGRGSTQATEVAGRARPGGPPPPLSPLPGGGEALMVLQEQIGISTRGHRDMHDLTEGVAAVVARSKV